MSSLISQVIVSSEILPSSVVREMQRWGLPLTRSDEQLKSKEDIMSAIEAALDERDTLDIRVTDLELIKHFLSTQTKGKLHIASDTEPTGTTFSMMYGTTPRGEYIIPWRSENIQELMTHPKTYLKVGDEKVFFGSVREMFFGGTKAFMVCVPHEVQS